MNFRALLFSLTASTCFSEVLTLNTGARFEGELISISPQEGVLIETPRTPEPLALRPDSFSVLEMNDNIEENPLQTERIVLANGDILPGNLRSLNDDEIVYEGLVGGKLVLTRDKVTTLRFGIKPQSLQYEGPMPLSEWSGTGAEQWIVSQDPADGLLMLEPGKMKKDVNLGSQFILKFDLKWRERPALRIWFGSEDSEEERQDRYYIELNGSGVQIKRERSIEDQWLTTLLSLSQLESFDDSHVSVELRVNRLIGTLDLYLDDELIRQMHDSDPPTKGDFIILERSRSDNSTSYLSNLKVFSWDAVSQIELMEEPGKGEVDSLVDAQGKRISGQLVGLFPKEEVPEAPESEEDDAEEPAAGTSSGENQQQRNQQQRSLNQRKPFQVTFSLKVPLLMSLSKSRQETHASSTSRTPSKTLHPVSSPNTNSTWPMTASFQRPLFQWTTNKLPWSTLS